MSSYFITSYINNYAPSAAYKYDYGVTADYVDALFTSAAGKTQEQMDSLSGTVLGQAIDHFTDGNYEQAIQSFRGAAALSPFSDNASSAYKYMGQAYEKLEDTDNAIKTYQEAIRQFPTSDEFYVALGDLYMKDADTLDEAVKAYEQAVKINPNDAESQYSLGQAYLTAGEPDKAAERFNEVVRISPSNASGYYGLGEVARADGDYSKAVSLLTRAQSIDKDFELAYLELGYTYADMGDFFNAEDQLSILEVNSSDYATTLSNYIDKATPPEIFAGSSSDGFNTFLGPETNVSSLSSKLATADSSKLFSMTFTFTKSMDPLSIINSKNWTISRATLTTNGGLYNYGLPVSSKEASIDSTPAFVTFSEEENVATVYFRVFQNEDANATIDPKHIVFKFSGVDAYGKTMAETGDEYAGFSGIA